jgi:isopentenyl phosphate kinase
VRQSVTKLANIIGDRLISDGINVALCSPFCSWEIKNSVPICHNLEQIQMLLARGFIPLLHGDVVFNSLTNFSILSGDTITKVLAEKLKPKRVVFLSNVDGIYTLPPEQENAELITDIALNSNGTITLPQTNCCAHDVTGGIMFKLTEAIDIVNYGVDVFFANAGSDSAIDACLGKLELDRRYTYMHK